MVAIGAERQHLIWESGVVLSPHQCTLLPLAGRSAVTFALKTPIIDKSLLEPLLCKFPHQDCDMQACRLYHVQVLCEEMLWDITNSI